MDIAENGLRAGATRIGVSIVEDIKNNRLKITITDNGKGLSDKMLRQIMDPFFTTRTTRRIGLGLSLFREAVKRCDGEFSIKSKEGEGTEVRATFRLDHIDLAPLGNIAGSLTSMIMGNSEVDFFYSHEKDDDVFELDTRQIKDELEGVPINHPKVIRYIEDTIRDSLSKM